MSLCTCTYCLSNHNKLQLLFQHKYFWSHICKHHLPYHMFQGLYTLEEKTYTCKRYQMHHSTFQLIASNTSQALMNICICYQLHHSMLRRIMRHMNYRNCTCKPHLHGHMFQAMCKRLKWLNTCISCLQHHNRLQLIGLHMWMKNHIYTIPIHRFRPILNR